MRTKQLALDEANAFWDSLTDKQRTDMQMNQTLVQKCYDGKSNCRMRFIKKVIEGC